MLRATKSRRHHPLLDDRGRGQTPLGQPSFELADAIIMFILIFHPRAWSPANQALDFDDAGVRANLPKFVVSHQSRTSNSLLKGVMLGAEGNAHYRGRRAFFGLRI